MKKPLRYKGKMAAGRKAAHGAHVITATGKEFATPREKTWFDLPSAMRLAFF